MDDCNSVEEYLTKRLNWNESHLAKFKTAFPVLFKFSVHKLSEHIDYLLNEASYTTDDINGHIFILRCSLTEIKCRLHELNALNYRPKLYLLASTRRSYLDKIKVLCREAENGMRKYEKIESRVRAQKSSKVKQ